MERVVAEPNTSMDTVEVERRPPEATNSFHQSGDVDERLIEEVRKREPLYNFRLPLAQRGRKQAKQMWQDISTELNGNATKYYIFYLCN